MIRAMLLVGSAVIVLSGALIAVGEDEFVDPVCGMTVSPENAAASATVNGKAYYFCNTGCYDKFMSDPKTYVAAAGQEMDSHDHVSEASHEMGSHSHGAESEHTMSSETGAEHDMSTLEGSMEKLDMLMLQAVEGVLHGEHEKVKKASTEIAETSEMLKQFSRGYAGIRAPGFDAYAIELGKTATALEKSLGDSTQQVFNSLSMTLSTCVSCHMNFRDVRSGSTEYHH
jgi:YHS domain-containing protein